jgi:hypothetical protein
MTITDQRPIPEFPPNIEVVTKINTKSIFRAIVQGLKRSAKRLEPQA